MKGETTRISEVLLLETIYISDFVLVDLHEGPLQGKINRL